MYRHENAACWDRTKLFFSDSRPDQRQAAGICGDCIYKQQCYAEAGEQGETAGIWGGVLFHGRKRIDPLAPKRITKHGTHGAYQKHIRAGERPCAECLQAHALYHREHRLKRKEAA